MSDGIYNTGTASVANGGTTVTIAGGIMSGTAASKYDVFFIGGGSALIVDVVDATHLTITPWPGATASGATYTIYQAGSLRYDDVKLAEDLRAQVAALNTEGFYVFVPSASTDPDPSLGDNGQYAFQATSGKLWVKDAGLWTYLGIYKGFAFKSAWSSATSYTVNDVVTIGGSSYIAIAASTNQTPPNATYWTLLAGKGDKGDKGDTGPSVLLPIAAWVTATAYVVGPPASFVSQSGSAYQCLIAHTSSGSFAADLAAGNWGLIAQKGTDGTGTGDMQGANNLADVASKIAALDNLHLRASDIASAATVNLDSATGDLVGITGTTTITAITLATGRERTVRFAGALTLTNNANISLPRGANITTAVGDVAVFRAMNSTLVICVSYTSAVGSYVINTLTSDVVLNNTSVFVDALTVVLGSVGTWLVTSSMTVRDTAVAATIGGRLWDGTTIIDSAIATTAAGASYVTISMSGIIVNPAGNIRLGARDYTATTGQIKADGSGVGKDTTLTAIRIA